jgi:hypothetical protein
MSTAKAGIVCLNLVVDGALRRLRSRTQHQAEQVNVVAHALKLRVPPSLR